MYLRKIEMKGFKSFADKTKVGFESGITCIVGPNGSGKSNITDAIRWVLGEQKVKSLRSQKMEDVIFNGTKARSSVGLAEVALTFDNTEGYFPLDFKEVKVQRKVYRSGESEYKINNTVCRLRDIRELFMDTGIGTDGYSIIGQGQIDDLLSKNREDRRLLFEEAAGISKFKAKKKVAERKLAKTEENLIRVEDILSELKKRRDPLKKQAEKAKRYLELSEKLKRRYLKRVAADYQELGEKQRVLQTERDQLREGLEEQLTKRDRYDAEIARLDQSVSDKNEAIERGGQILRDLDEVISDLKTTVTLNEEKITEINRRFTEVELDLKHRQEEHTKGEAEQRDLVKDLEAIDEALEHTEEKLAAHRKKLATEADQRGEKEESLRLLLEKQESNRREISKLSNERAVLRELLADDERRAKEQADDLAGQESESQTLIEQLAEQEREQSERIAARDALVSEIADVQKRLEASGLERRRHENALRDAEVKRDKIRNERKLLTGYEASYEGYDYTVKRLMGYLADRPEEKARTVGVVAELLRVPKDYEKAVETALGRSLQYVVSERLSDVKHLIRVLKEKRMGRTSFIPLDEIRDRSVHLDASVLAEEGFLGRGVDLVQFDPVHQKLFGYLLGHILVVRDFDTAENLVKKHRIRQRLVTLDGDIINPGGIVTGGASAKGRSSGILERKRKIAQLKDEIKAITEKIATCGEELDGAIRREDALVEKRDLLAERRDTLDYRIEVQGAQIDQIKQSIERSEKERDREALRLGDLRRLIGEKQEAIRSKTDALAHLTEASEELTRERESLEIAIASIEEAHAKAREDAVALEIDRTRHLESKQFKMAALRKLEVQLKEEELSLERRFADHAQLRDEKKHLADQLLEARASIEQKSGEKEAVEAGRQRTVQERDTARNQLTKLREESRLLIESLEQVREEEHRLSLSLTKIEGNLEHLKEEVYDRYNLSIASAFENYRDLDLSDIEEDEKTLKSAIAKLGSVNLEAIEEFEEVEERYTFLSGQMDDLLAAKKELVGVVRTLDKQMKSQFLEHFEKVRVAFSETFTDLFNGGFCDLELTDPEDVLETDIAIVAQPPGKKLQSIDLLSGGEKALTAISLLFAILKIKPAPFCVLDEIEAALDDVNVYRFSDFLKKMTDRSQFLVITHRKGTMEIADALYGITMEEYGISKVVSLKLEDYEGGQYA